VLYYYSEPALTHELAYEHSPGEWLPSIPVTPETRPWGGAGLI
jgi:gluconate 2-dehydrogenase gamma chain